MKKLTEEIMFVVPMLIVIFLLLMMLFVGGCSSEEHCSDAYVKFYKPVLLWDGSTGYEPVYGCDQ
jgi:hypothetical protein